MYYWKICLANEEAFLEHKLYLNDNRVIREAIDQGVIAPHDQVLEIDEITEDEYEENCLNF